MKKKLIALGLMVVTMAASPLPMLAEGYVIYPIPRQMTTGTGSLSLTPKILLSCETGIDEATRNRATSVLEAHGLQVITEAEETPCTTLRLGMTNICMRDNFGVEVDYNVEIDFESFIRVVDFMGGIEIELTEAEAKYLNDDDLYVKYDVQPGLQYLDGMAALSYARMRKAEGDNDSDIKRSARQRLVIETLLNKVRGLSLKELQDVADTLLPLITTTMKPGDIVDVLTRILPVFDQIHIVGETIPYGKTGWGDMIDIYEDGIMDSIIRFEAPQQKKLIRAITEAEEN